MRSSKYGASNRKLHDFAIKSKNKRYECPKCAKLKVIRKGNSIWKCKSCGGVFAGAAYSLTTKTGEVAKRLVGEYSKAA